MKFALYVTLSFMVIWYILALLISSIFKSSVGLDCVPVIMLVFYGALGINYLKKK